MSIALPRLANRTAIAQTPASERGQAIAPYRRAYRHASGGDDLSPMALPPPLRDLWQRYPIEMLAEALAEGITTGHPAMPDFACSPRGIDALLSYIDPLSASSKPRNNGR
jgi:cytochrome c